MSYLRLENISKQFGKKEVLRDISLEIREETFCVFLGPSGCGKSTLLNIIAGLEKPTRGRLFLRGEDITDLPPHKRNMAMVFQNYALYPHLSAYENMAFGLRAGKCGKEAIDEKVRRASRILDIEDKLENYPRQLSGGERQRVATGRAIVRDPNLFLFDEPLSNLDARLRLELRKEFLTLQQRLKKTSLYVTHDQIEALSLGDMIVVLKEGEVQQVSGPSELYRSPANLFTAGFIGTPPMNIIEMDIRQDDGKPELVKGAFSLPLPSRLDPGLKKRKEHRLFWGIRPSAVALRKEAKRKYHECRAKVEFTELLGEDVLVYLRLRDAVELKATFPEDEWKPQTEDVTVYLPEDAMYFFDSSGRVVGCE